MDKVGAQQLRLLAASAHDLKTPLIFIKGAAAQAGQAGLNAQQQRQLIKRIELSSDRLLKLIDAIIGSAQTSQTQLPLEPAHVSDVLWQAQADIEPYARELGFTFDIRIPRRLPPVLTHRLGLRRILFNLMDNAVKYGHNRPQAVIRAERESSGNFVRLSVRDYGVGLRPSDFKQIQALYAKAEQPTAAAPGSSGLGLLLSSQLADSLSAKLTFQPLAVGTSFSLRLPIARQLSLFT